MTRVTYQADGSVDIEVSCDRQYRGGPTVAHGGWISAIFDDALAVAVLQADAKVVTGELSVRYVRPVPIERPLLITSRIAGHDGRKWFVEGSMALRTPGAPVLATAHAIFLSRSADHFVRHQQWLDAQSNAHSGRHQDQTTD
ncbi:PaaI family thioesterase [Rhodococcus sp. OAS809]|uniref:PaaI family thioesterase n=1 Tax=Rhodococcus sp. OAS809 TaxID=2663874 RepID=UPI0017898F85